MESAEQSLLWASFSSWLPFSENLASRFRTVACRIECDCACRRLHPAGLAATEMNKGGQSPSPRPPEPVRSVNHFGLKNRERGEHRRTWLETSYSGARAGDLGPSRENRAQFRSAKCLWLLGICADPPPIASVPSVNHGSRPQRAHLLSPPRTGRITNHSLFSGLRPRC